MMKWSIKYTKINIKELNKEYDILLKKNDFGDGISLSNFLKKVDNDTYKNIKSWRSNVLEGNTTKIKNLKKIIDSGKKDFNNIEVKFLNESNFLDEEKEIINLVKAYNKKTSFKLSSIQEVNYILGNSIKHNDFFKHNGRLKKENNYILHKENDEFTIYEIVFCKPEFAKEEINKLLTFLNSKLKNNMTFTEAFILAIIFNLEFNRIHPFHDGNGRTSRLFFEKIFEKYDYTPLIFSTKNSKRKYKEALLNSDIQIHLSEYKIRHNYSDVLKIFIDMYNTESEELAKQIDKFKTQK